MNLIAPLAHRIEKDLAELQIVLDRIKLGWQRARLSNDDFYLDSVALNLHGLYSGLERIFERIAETMDGSMPSGENWHQLLLIQMSKEVPGIRPAVISRDTCRCLDEYRGFRHVVRNIYTFMFDPAKLEKLVDNAPVIFSQLHDELDAFILFLRQANY